MPKPRRSFVLLLFQIFILRLALTISGIRKDVGLKDKRICRTTVQGRYLLSDDWGHVCDALSVDPVSRCCSEKGEQFDCHGCNLDSQCCNSYEFCVSCCQDPAHTHKELALSVKIAKAATAGEVCWTFPLFFEEDGPILVFLIFVLGGVAIILRVWFMKMLTSAISITAFLFHQILQDKIPVLHYYNCRQLIEGQQVEATGPDLGRILYQNTTGTTGDHVEAGLAGINVIVGRQGESCDSVCKSNGQSCVPNKLVALNQCEIIQKYMRCKGACLASIGADQPAEVVDDAPRHLNPGACLYTRTPSLLSCDGLHRHTKRLCPCA